MRHNAAMPVLEVDPETYEVRADGVLLTCEPAESPADGAAVFSVLSCVAPFGRACGGVLFPAVSLPYTFLEVTSRLTC